MNRSFIRINTLRATVLAVAAAFSGCSAGYTTDNDAGVLLLIQQINGGDILKSDVLKDGGVFQDEVKVVLGVRSKNPNITTSASVPNQVIIDRYEVHYRRSDGRGVEGQDVPYAISGNMTASIDVSPSGTTEIILEVVRIQAKLEPPLRNLVSVTANGGGGGGLIFTAFADITLHGHTVAGKTVTASGSLQIDFANFGG